MAGSIIGIAGSVLNAQGGPPVIGHDIGNASAEGLRRQHAVDDGAVPGGAGSAAGAEGASADTLRHAYSRFLDDSLLQAQTRSACLETCHGQLRQVAQLLSAPAAGVPPALRAFFSGVQEVASHPASMPPRQQLLGLAQALVTSFRALGTHLTEMRQALNLQIADAVAEINALAGELARFNEQILHAGARGRAPSDDLVRRGERLTEQLSMLACVSAMRQPDGSIDVFVGNDLSLVLGDTACALAAAPWGEDAEDHGIFYTSRRVRVPLAAAGLRGGSASGLLAFRSETLDWAQNQLGRIAVVLAHTFNDQHRMGMDLQGDPGQDFFDAPRAAVLENRDNTGSAVVAADHSNVGALTASDYRLQFNAGSWTLTRLSDNTQTLFTGFPQTVDGVTLTLASGAADNGDRFLIQPTRNGVRDIALATSDPARIAAAVPGRYNANGIYDNRNALPLAALQTRSTIANGAANYLSAYDRVVEEVAAHAHAVEIQCKAQDALVKEARATRQSLLGVNLAEEAATLIRRQQAYQASGKALQAAARLLDSVLDLA